MKYRKFGKTGLDISVLGFGTMRLPYCDINGKRQIDYDKGVELIQRAFELGVNYVDTAPYYCDSLSEVVVGRALKGWRDKVYLSTKNPIENDSGDDFIKRLEKSLKQLDTDYIDFYHMWGINWDTFTNKINVPSGPLQAALKAKEQGLIKHMSFSFHDVPENMLKIIDTGYFETLLCQYNLLDRSNEKGLEYATSKGLGTVVMGPVGGGRLGMPSEAIKKLIKGDIKSSAEMALRYVIANSNVTCALSGMENLTQLEQNVAVAEMDYALSQTELQQVQDSLEEKKKLAELYCTGCNYCMPCPSNVNIPLNFSIMNYHKVYGLTDLAKAQYKEIGTVGHMPGEKADKCIECGLCEEKCPQKIKIREQLKETAKVLG